MCFQQRFPDISKIDVDVQRDVASFAAHHIDRHHSDGTSRVSRFIGVVTANRNDVTSATPQHQQSRNDDKRREVEHRFIAGASGAEVGPGQHAHHQGQWTRDQPGRSSRTKQLRGRTTSVGVKIGHDDVVEHGRNLHNLLLTFLYLTHFVSSVER